MIECPGMVIKCTGAGGEVKPKTLPGRNLLGSKTCYQCGHSLEGESKSAAMKGTLLEAKPAATVDAV